MKNSICLLTAFLFTQLVFGQSSGSCISCNNNVIDTLNHSSAIGSDNISTGLNSFASGFQNEAISDYSFTLGNENIVEGKYGVAIGYGNQVSGMLSVALGSWCKTYRSYSIAIGKGCEADSLSTALGFHAAALNGRNFAFGHFVKSSGERSMTLGAGIYNSTYLENSIENSLMVGFISDVPTLFISSSNGAGTTGKIGIGNVTDPQAKLHIKADIAEDASLLLQPISGTNYGVLKLYDNNHTIKVRNGDDMIFTSGPDNHFIFQDGNLGVGTQEPGARLHIKDGDIYIEDIEHGIIMKSPDGNCWRGTINNNGALQFSMVNCDNLVTDIEDDPEKKLNGINIYPNPTGGKVYISFDQTHVGSLLEILDINGKIFYSERLINSESYIDLNAYKSGWYIFNLIDDIGNVIASKKIAKK